MFKIFCIEGWHRHNQYRDSNGIEAGDKRHRFRETEESRDTQTNKARAEAKTQGLKIVMLQVNETNLSAIALDKKVGFKVTGKIPKAVLWNGKYVADTIMAKEIS